MFANEDPRDRGELKRPQGETTKQHNNGAPSLEDQTAAPSFFFLPLVTP